MAPRQRFRAAPYLHALRAATGLDGQYPAALDEALCHPRLVVVGGANAGKSTFLRQVAYLWAGGLLDVHTDTLLLPLLIDGGDLAVHLGRNAATGDAMAWLASFLAWRNEECGWGLAEEFFRSRLEHGACLILLDGLDRIPQASGRRSVCRALESIAGNGPLGRAVIATRAEGLVEMTGFVTVRIDELPV